MNRKRIVIAGFQHETNTFAPGRAGLDEFTMADSWPGMLHGKQVIEHTRGMNLPVSGAVKVAEQHGVELIPILWCAAEPSGPVTTEAFEQIAHEIVHYIGSIPQPDAIYLDLHGAMVTDQYQDGEGELLRRLRAGPAADIPIGISLDLHANVSEAMVQSSDVIAVYRTYPHLDMAETGGRCMSRLLAWLDGHLMTSVFRRCPYLIPLHAQYTGQMPCSTLYQALTQLAHQEQDEYLELAMGFTGADIADCGPVVVAGATNRQRADELAEAISSLLIHCESEFDVRLFDVHTAVRLAKASTGSQPAVIADVQDNAGAGGTADTTGLLQALIDAGAERAVLGVICDPIVAAMAHEAGPGQTFQASLGARTAIPGNVPVTALYRVERLSNGRIEYTGQMYGGVTASIGPSCLLSLQQEDAGIQIVVSSYRTQCLDQALFTHFGVDLMQQQIIAVKSTVHFRADFQPIASTVINVRSPGAFSCELTDLDYKHLPSGLRLGPLGKPYQAV